MCTKFPVYVDKTTIHKHRDSLISIFQDIRRCNKRKLEIYKLCENVVKMVILKNVIVWVLFMGKQFGAVDENPI